MILPAGAYKASYSKTNFWFFKFSNFLFDDSRFFI